MLNKLLVNICMFAYVTIYEKHGKQQTPTHIVNNNQNTWSTICFTNTWSNIVKNIVKYHPNTWSPIVETHDQQ
jgi:hypothetical protein